ncbi:Carboxymuconolactone decarboxylase family protein [Rubripirellula amarantea]|uniref:Carboxymuconolactone decarboxylase family protein n=1 Tax=Rubripirellula amarantea TaxID=2527999 RepID=A0A5C5WE74_9BACT|nr:carboxymuconolactone decarboxylase family protein [Rubripirellula amarantea]TWT48032.1 Carboxymuconolactone decarboxylase family protein [Rubripirellula amarantea]
MSYVDPLQLDEAPEDSKPLLKSIEKKFGQSLNLFSTLAHQPDVLGGVTQINDGLQNDLPAKFRELAYYKASQLNSCDYCSHYHRQAALKAGLSEEQLDSMNADALDLFDEQERAVLQYADQLTQTANVDSNVVEKVKTFLDDRQLVTLAAAVALANFTNRVNHGLAIELP